MLIPTDRLESKMCTPYTLHASRFRICNFIVHASCFFFSICVRCDELLRNSPLHSNKICHASVSYLCAWMRFWAHTVLRLANRTVQMCCTFLYTQMFYLYLSYRKSAYTLRCTLPLQTVLIVLENYAIKLHGRSMHRVSLWRTHVCRICSMIREATSSDALRTHMYCFCALARLIGGANTSEHQISYLHFSPLSRLSRVVTALLLCYTERITLFCFADWQNETN